MNKIYRSIWNEITQTYVAAAEIVRGKGKRSASSADASPAQDESLRVSARASLSEPPERKSRLVFGGIRPMVLEQRFMFDGAAVAEAVQVTDSGTAQADATATDATPSDPSLSDLWVADPAPSADVPAEQAPEASTPLVDEPAPVATDTETVTTDPAPLTDAPVEQTPDAGTTQTDEIAPVASDSEATMTDLAPTADAPVEQAPEASTTPVDEPAPVTTDTEAVTTDPAPSADVPAEQAPEASATPVDEPAPVATETQTVATEFPTVSDAEASQVPEATATPAQDPVATTANSEVWAADLLQFVDAGAEASASLTVAHAEAERLVVEFLQRPDAREQLFALFDGGQSAPSEAWSTAVDALLAGVQSGNFSVKADLRSNTELQGALGAYAMAGPDGNPKVYLNADWLNGGASIYEITRVLVEEIGHAIDGAINKGVDTVGDEGEAFAVSVLALQVSDSEWQLINTQNDSNLIQIDGQSVTVEDAAVTFSQVFVGTPTSLSEEAQSLNNLQLVTGTNFRFTSLDPSAPYYSGNNVTGMLSYRDEGGSLVQLQGVVSRLFKSGSNVEGFYFYYPGEDGVIGTSVNNDGERAYLLESPLFPNTAWNLISEGTSSDPVDTALNKLLTFNTAPVLANDSLTVAEGANSNNSGNVLTNDTDANGDNLTVTAFSIAGEVGPFVLGQNYMISGKGTLRLSSDGSYTFTPSGDYYGPVPLVTYTASDGRGGNATATLAITVTPVNDPPTSSNDTFNVSANTKTALSLTDFGIYADTEGSPLASIEITTLPATGKLEYFNGSSWVAVTAGDRITASAISAGCLRYTGGSDSLTFKVNDGTDWSSSAYTLTIAATVVANQAPDAINDSNIVTKSVSLTASGNVLTNDSDPDGVNSAITVSRASKGGTLGGTISTIGADTSSTGTEALTYLTLNLTQGVGNIKTSEAVSGTGVPAGTTVASRDPNSQTVTLSTPALLNVGNTVTINGAAYTVGAVSAPSSTIIALSGVTGYGISVGTAVSTPSGSGLTITGSTTTVKSVTPVGTYTFVELNSTVSGTPVAGGGNDLLFGTRASATIVGTYGTLTLNQNGSYSYTANSDAADGSVDTFTYEAKDANGGLDSATLTITIRVGNTAPVNALPTSLLVDIGGQLPISTLTVSDTNENLSSVTLSVTKGTLSASTLGAGSASGKGTTSLTLSGTQADINAMLATLVYTANTNASGTDTLTVLSTDSGSLPDNDIYTISLRAAPTVTGTVVNEASPYVYFTVSGEVSQSVAVYLSGAPSNGTATIGSDVLPNLEYYDGSAWRSYTGAVNIPAINGSGKLFVRTAVLQDIVSEGSETLRLTATNVAGVSNTGDSTIRDDGLGDIYDGTISGDGSLNTTGGTPDDDRPLGVNNIFVNEGSLYAVFEVTGVAGQSVSLALQEGTANNSGGDPDFGSVLQYLNSSNQWTTYSGAISIPTGGKLLVRTAIVNNAIYEGAENFGLVATNTGGVSTTGTAVILDDGTGAYYPDNTTGTTDPAATLDRDTAITVTARSPVNEASPYAIFTVLATSGLDIGLLLNNGTAELDLSSASIDYSYEGSSWTSYTWNGTSGNPLPRM